MQNSDIKILLVDDDDDTLEFIKYNLEEEGFQIATAENGNEAVKKAKEFQPHLIILDVMMPVMDGVETCNELRQLPDFKNTIITFLTARHEDYSQIAGFEAGADDYISKPIKPRLLTSKIKSLLKRIINEEKQNIIESNNIKIDLNQHLIFIDDKKIFLPKKEYNLLCLLMSKPGRVFTRKEILTKVWGTETIVVDRTIDVHIRKLREKIGNNYFLTIKGVGYKFNA